jgi:ribosomal protein S18 acetylase RimI-like enzyme
MNAKSNYRLLTHADVEEAAQVIAQAFIDDPLCAFILPIKRTRTRSLYTFFRVYGEVNIKNNCGFGVGDPLQAVAYWQFPDQANLSISVKTLWRFLPLLFTFYPIGYFRAKAILNRQDALHDKYAPEPHFYLDNIGVLASARGQGLSSRLIRPFLEMADSQKVMAYTDTVTRSNVALYEHFGFQCVEECPISGTDITVWALRRPAQQ